MAPPCLGENVGFPSIADLRQHSGQAIRQKLPGLPAFSAVIEKHEKDNFFAHIPGLTLRLSPELAALDRVLDDDELYGRIRADLAQHYPQTLTAGCHSTPAGVILRMLEVRHLYNLSYEQTGQQVADSPVLRQFCRVYFQAVPDPTTV